MDHQACDEEARFAKYVESLAGVIGHADRVVPLRHYCVGLLAAEGRKSVEPLAAVTAPAGLAAQHQKLLHFVANSAWSDEEVLAKVREIAVPAMERSGPIEAWIIDDTAFPKQGKHSVGVQHQYCGQLGKQANCQVVVTVSIANHHASLPIAYRLYLPEEWAKDRARRKEAHVPKEIRFKTKPQIALDQLRLARAAGVPCGVVLMDASYGSNAELRSGVSALALDYVAGIIDRIKVAPVRNGITSKQRVSVKELALGLPKHAWRTITWREGSASKLSSRFARVQVRTAPIRGASRRGEETLLIEWPQDAPEPTKYWLSTLDPKVSFRHLVDLAKMRWRIERDYQELKQEIGLGHYEGRGWRGFHHHGTLCIAAYGFLIAEQAAIPPSGPAPSRNVKKLALPEGYRPRGAPDPAATSRPSFNRHTAPQAAGGARAKPAAMSNLRTRLHPQDAKWLVT
jgi:SRSO17 transposase